MTCKHESTHTAISVSQSPRERCLSCGAVRVHTFWGSTLWTLRLGLLGLLLSGCGVDLPSEISIEPGFSPVQEAAARDAIDHWCDATAGQWCPRVMGAGSVGAAPIVPLSSAAYERTANPDSWSVNRGEEKILVDVEAMTANPDFSWQVFAHELGHFAIEGHTRSGTLMGRAPTVPLYCIDLTSARRFCRDAGMKGCVSTC